MIPGPSRSLLQRRSSLTTAIQPTLDGLAVLGVSFLLIDIYVGVLTPEYMIMLLMLLGTLAVTYDHYAIYRSNSKFAMKAFRLFKAWTASFIFMLVLAFLTKQSEAYSRVVVTGIFVIGLSSQLILHFFFRLLQKTLLEHTQQPDNAIIIGSGRLSAFLFQKINSNPWLGEKVVGCLTIEKSSKRRRASDLGRRQSDVQEISSETPILGTIDDWDDVIREYKIRTVYFVTPLNDAELLEELYFKLLDKHVAVHWVPDIFSLRLVNHSVREIAGVPLITLSETPLTGTRLVMKTLEDYILGVVILVLVAPILAVVAVAIKLDSPGPVFFRQPRMGWNGKIFRIWKFRSMIAHQPKDGVIKQAERGDPRITRVGSFIRRTSIDELPQIFNVLTGEMSLVGPRPHAVQHDEEYSRRINDYFARHNIKPGITGLAQVRGFRGETRDIEQMIERIESDIEYINNWSIWLDISILFRTTSAFTGKNAY